MGLSITAYKNIRLIKQPITNIPNSIEIDIGQEWQQADNNLGEIGCHTCKKILQDLITIKPQYLNDHHKKILDDLIITFSFACNNGFVRFH